jgi:hypothetical protein
MNEVLAVDAEECAAGKIKGVTEMQSSEMDSDAVVVSRVRPVSWKVFVLGKAAADYLRGFLGGMRMDCSEPVEESELHDTATFSLVVTPSPETPLTAEELVALLQDDKRITVAFDSG